MAMRFLARHKKAVLVAVAFAGVLALTTARWRRDDDPGIMEKGVMSLASPFLKGLDALSNFTEGTVDFLFGWRRLKEENRYLKDEMIRLRQEAAAGREERIAYRRLAAMLEFKQRTGFRMVAAAVIGSDTTNLFRSVIINKGTRDGVRKNMPVVSPEGAVGKVIRVYGGSAQVLLVTDRSSGIDALVQRTRDQGVVQGLGSDRCEMKYLSRQSAIAAGDVIVTSGMGGIFPKGVAVGRVSDVRKGGGLLQKVEVIPAAALSNLEEVMILLDAGREEGS